MLSLRLKLRLSAFFSLCVCIFPQCVYFNSYPTSLNSHITHTPHARADTITHPPGPPTPPCCSCQLQFACWRNTFHFYPDQFTYDAICCKYFAHISKLYKVILLFNVFPFGFVFTSNNWCRCFVLRVLNFSLSKLCTTLSLSQLNLYRFPQLSTLSTLYLTKLSTKPNASI